MTPTFDPLGISLDPFAALANHSCDPNAVVVMNGPELSFRSLRLIEKDKEILISYIDITNPIARRQAELEERYFFECDCSKCQLGQSEKEDKWALPPEQLPEKWAKAAEAIIANEPSVLQGLPSFDTADNNLEAWKRLAALQYTAFAELEHARQLDDIPMMTQKLEGGMVTCFQSKMWPLYRQPYAALRDDLIVAYLTSGEPPKFVAAFQHAVRRYFEIDPILYPQPFHPVRVVHIWTLLMLALWLASAPEDCPMDAMKFLEIGIDLGVVIFNLLLEANAEVHKSHGRSSKFAQTVLKKFEEVRMDMSRGDPRIIDEVTRRREEQWKTLRAFGHETEV